MVDDTPVPSEQRFRHSIEGLTRSLGERAALHPDPVGEAIARRAAVQALFRARARRLKWMVAGGGAAAVAVAASLVFFAASPMPPAAPVQVVAAAVVPPPAPPPPPAPVASAAQPAPAAQPVGVSELPVPPPPAPQEAALGRDEVREIQTRLLAFGFNPGPVDGDLGRRTQGAVMRYQQERGRAETGTADRELLEQLRRDPAPKIVVARQAAPREPPRATAQYRPRSDPFAFLRTADANLTQWFQSLSR